ncbi:MAG: DUF3105 domain-containing protein [Solirubrobacteraceae bacterium]
MTKARSTIEWVVIVLVALAIAAGAIALLSGYFAGNDTPGVSGSSSAPGNAFKDMGDAHRRPGQTPPRYSSNPPTSGPHVPTAVRKDRAVLTNNQLLEALELGDVVLVYGSAAPPAGLESVARANAAPFTPALAAAGQAVILARRPGTHGVVGLAWAHLIRVAEPAAPSLRQFIQYWLGRGAPSR